MNSRTKVTLALFMVIIFFAFMAFRSFDKSVAYYYTLSEVKDLESSQQLRVKGTLVKESVNWNPDIPRLQFTLTDGHNNLEMVYHGVMPDNFGHVQELIVEGKIGEEGRFEISKLMLQCPSKYEKGEE